MKRTTIKDVAKEARVSITTVSHALSGGGNLKQETRDRVVAVARQMRYVPDWNSSNLKAVGNKCIGLFAPSIRGYYGVLADVIYEECRTEGYELEIFIADRSETLVRTLLGRRVEGAVVLHGGLIDQDEEMLLESEMPMVFLDREVKRRKVSSVLFDSYRTGRMVAEFLFSLGHRRMMTVKGANTYDGNERQRGFEDYMREQGFPVQPDYIVSGEFDQWVTYESIVNFINRRLPMPDAIFAANDDSAFGCIKALMMAGYSVPGDISVIGCDDIELSQWYTPALTTVRTHIQEQASQVAKEVMGLIRGEKQGSVQRIEAQIVSRGSCINR